MVVHAPHQAARHQRRGTLLPQSFPSWSMIAAPGSLPLIPPDDETQGVSLADASLPPQTFGRPAPVFDWRRPSAPRGWTVRRSLLNPVSSLASVGKKDRQEGEGACLPVCREAITSFSRSRPPRVAAPRARERAPHGPDRCACGVLKTLHSGTVAWDNTEGMT